MVPPAKKGKNVRGKGAGTRRDSRRLWGARLGKSPAPRTLLFLCGRDASPLLPSDILLLPHDVSGSIVHARMLARQGIISGKELSALLSGLRRIGKSGVALTPQSEDVHTAVEKALGKAGLPLHTARSRNDQVALDTRLFLKEAAEEYSFLLGKLILALLSCAERNARAVMPGYTHQRRAMVTTLGHYFFSVACGLERDRTRFLQWSALFDKSPLGGAASYGTAFPIDRRYTARELGFSAPEPSSLDPVQNRWEPEATFAFAACTAMDHLSSFGQTLIVLSSPEFGFLSLPDEFCTGSSMMPQKKNPDFLEAVRGRASLCHGHLLSLLSEGQASFMGYNRDSQVTKQLVMDVILETRPALELFPSLVFGIRPDAGRMKEEAGRHFISATHFLEAFVAKTGVPFRKAKVLVEKAVKLSEETDGADRITYGAYLAAGGPKEAFSADELEAAQDPERIVDAYSSEGSPNPRLLLAQIAAMRKRVRGG